MHKACNPATAAALLAALHVTQLGQVVQIQTALRARGWCSYPCKFRLQLLPMLQKVQGQEAQRQSQGLRAPQPELTPEEKERMHAFANRAVSEFAKVGACLAWAVSKVAEAGACLAWAVSECAEVGACESVSAGAFLVFAGML